MSPRTKSKSTMLVVERVKSSINWTRCGENERSQIKDVAIRSHNCREISFKIEIIFYAENEEETVYIGVHLEYCHLKKTRKYYELYNIIINRHLRGGELQSL